MNFNSLRNQIANKNISVKELVNDFFSKIDAINPKINAYINTTKDADESSFLNEGLKWKNKIYDPLNIKM